MTRWTWRVWLPSVLLVSAALACNLITGSETKKEATKIAKSSLPGVVIQAPEDGAQVLQNTDVLIYAIATDAVGVTRIEMFADGFVVASQASPNLEQGDTEFQVLLRWRPVAAGDHKLEVVPWRGDLRGTPATLTITARAQPGQIAQTPASTLSFLTPTPRIEDRTCRAQVAVGALNVRTGPGLVYDVINAVTIGTELTITGRQLYPDAWWQVVYGGRLGWMSGYYVNTLGDCSLIGIVLPPAPPTPRPGAVLPTLPPTNTPLPPTPTPFILTSTPLPPGTWTPTPTPEPCVATITQNNLLVYSGPGTNYSRMTILAAGQQFTVDGRDRSVQWAQIAIAGTHGWIEFQGTRLTGDCAGVTVRRVPPTPTSTPSSTPTRTLTLTVSPTATARARSNQRRPIRTHRRIRHLIRQRGRLPRARLRRVRSDQRRPIRTHRRIRHPTRRL